MKSRVSNRGALTPVRLLSETGSGMVILPQSGVQAQQPSSSHTLVFNRYGNIYYLTQVWRAGNSEGSQLATSRGEREMRRAGASAQPIDVYASAR